MENSSSKKERRALIKINLCSCSGNPLKTFCTWLGIMIGFALGIGLHHFVLCRWECPDRFAKEIVKAKDLQLERPKIHTLPGHLIPKELSGSRNWTYNDFMNAKAEAEHLDGYSQGWEVQFTLKDDSLGTLKYVRVGIRNVELSDIDQFQVRLVSKTYNPKGDIFKFIEEELKGYDCDEDENNKVLLCLPKDSIGKYIIMKNNKR